MAGVTEAAPVVITVVSEAILENYPNPTLVRQRGAVLAYLNAGGATLDSVLTMGMYFADKAAVTAGIASLELPNRDIGSDWLWWATIPLADNSGTIDQIRPTTSAHRIEIDGKAMRKAEPNQSLVFVAEVTDFGVSNASVAVNASARLLFKR